MATATGACSGGGDALRVYSGRHYGIEAAFEQFTEDTGIEVEFLTGNDSELREISAEGADTEADAYITVDAAISRRRPKRDCSSRWTPPCSKRRSRPS